MKKIDLGQGLTILANLGVIAGIFFLAVELNQTRDLTRAQIRHEITLAQLDEFNREADNAELAEIHIKVLNGQALSPAEEWRYRNGTWGFFRLMEDVHYQFRNGLFDEDEFDALLNGWRPRLSNPFINEMWCSQNMNYSREFVTAINQEFPELCLSID